MSADNPYAPPTAEVGDITSGEVAPPLWNPNVAASLSFFLTPLFGSVLHMKNWEAMGREDKAATSKSWAIVNVVYIVAMVLLLVFMPKSKTMDVLAKAGGLGMLLAWYFSLGKQQIKMVRDLYGKDYPRRGWAKPLLVAIGLYIAFIVAVGILVAFFAILKH